MGGDPRVDPSPATRVAVWKIMLVPGHAWYHPRGRTRGCAPTYVDFPPSAPFFIIRMEIPAPRRGRPVCRPVFGDSQSPMENHVGPRICWAPSVRAHTRVRPYRCGFATSARYILVFRSIIGSDPSPRCAGAHTGAPLPMWIFPVCAILHCPIWWCVSLTRGASARYITNAAMRPDSMVPG